MTPPPAARGSGPAGFMTSPHPFAATIAAELRGWRLPVDPGPAEAAAAYACSRLLEGVRVEVWQHYRGAAMVLDVGAAAGEVFPADGRRRTGTPGPGWACRGGFGPWCVEGPR